MRQFSILICLRLFLCWPFLSHCYAIQQGWGQVDILIRRQPINEVLQNSQTSPNVRKKLLFIQQVRRFAKERIKLKVHSSYQHYTQLDRPVLAWNVSASEKLNFRAKTWWFPIVGTLPYLGFFSQEDAKKKAKELEQEGWDVRINVVAAYSTLGWFDDPLISTQLNYSEWYLANLLIHECAHATLWFEDDVIFNESFASFAAKQGALQFYKETYGQKAYQQKIASLEKRKKQSLYFHIYAKRLASIYHSGLSAEEKSRQKAKQLIELERLIRQPNQQKEKDSKPSRSLKPTLNNADLMSYQRYHSGASYFNTVFQECRKQWLCFFSKMKELQPLSKTTRLKIWQKP